MTSPVRYPLVRRRPAVILLDLDSFARAAGAHPDHVRRLVALGLLEPQRAAEGGDLWFSPSEILALARIQRLRAGLAVNYAALGLVIDLLDRVAALEAEARTERPSRRRAQHTSDITGGELWTSTA
jgi:chaperone modulatory protein CbpM